MHSPVTIFIINKAVNNIFVSGTDKSAKRVKRVQYGGGKLVYTLVNNRFKLLSA